MQARAGDWVRIHKIILQAGQRASNIPKDTQNVPLEMWDKGFLLTESANVGDEVEIETYIGRNIKGYLVEVSPYYKHNFGRSVPETLYIGRQARELLSKESENIE